MFDRAPGPARPGAPEAGTRTGARLRPR